MMIKLIIMFFGQNTAEDVLCQYQNGDKMAAVRQMRINFPQAGASGIGRCKRRLPGFGLRNGGAGRSASVDFSKRPTPAQNFASLYDWTEMAASACSSF